GGASARKASAVRIISWLAQSMRWVVITALGRPVEPEVKRNLAMVSGVTAPLAASISAVGVAAENASHSWVGCPGGGLRRTSSGVAAGTAAAMAVAKRSPSLA